MRRNAITQTPKLPIGGDGSARLPKEIGLVLVSLVQSFAQGLE